MSEPACLMSDGNGLAYKSLQEMWTLQWIIGDDINCRGKSQQKKEETRSAINQDDRESTATLDNSS